MASSTNKRLARRALERQLAYQQRKSDMIAGWEDQLIAEMRAHSAAVHMKIGDVRPVPSDARVLEVGSGAHGLIFTFPAEDKVGIDPLADHYRDLFPGWQGWAKTISAFGEQLPFADATFDVVLCDNVVDHAESPRRIVEEMQRVLKVGGTLYFTVHFHHPLYHAASNLHKAWRSLGLPFEITPFADHTVHLTQPAALRLFDGLPLRLDKTWESGRTAHGQGLDRPPRHLGDRLKRWFFKNATLEVIATKMAA